MMKQNYFNSVIKVILILIVTNYVFAQNGWQWQNPLPQGADMFAVISLSSDKVVITGSGGTIMTIEDGGRGWNIQRLPQVDWVRKYSFVSEYEGWIIGNSSRILKTTNGGMKWQELSISIDIDFSNYGLDDIEFVNKRKGFLIANTPYARPHEERRNYPGRIYKTEDGGIHWTQVDKGIVADYHQIVFLDSLNGLLLSQDSYSPYYYEDAKLHLTNDGGNTWTTLPGQGYGKIQFINKQVGWAGNYKTTDAGQTWNHQQFNFPPLGNSVDRIWFTDTIVGYAISYKTILKTKDGGNSWSIQTETENGLLQDIQFYNSTIGYACGYGGTIYKTIDGGENWLRIGEGVTSELTDVDFIDENLGWAVGYDGTILHTTNGGSTWETQNIPEECNSAHFRAVDFIDSKSGWAAGGEYILTTENGGIEWSIQYKIEIDDPSGRLRDIKFLNNNIGFAVGQKSIYGEGMIYKTTDAGKNWQRVDEGNLLPLDEIYFVDDDYGWICGQGILLSTTDGGINWNADYFPEFLRYMQFTDREHGWISSIDEGAVYRTSDGGKTWIDIPYYDRYNQFFNSFFFFNNNQGIASTFLNNNILTTMDGGLHWSYKERLPPAQINIIKFVNYSLGWAVGTNGAIMKLKGSYFNNTNIESAYTNLKNYTSAISNYPNPFNSTTTISFYLSKQQNVTISIYDLTGRCIETFKINNTYEGKNEMKWQPKNYVSGIYLAKISCSEYSKVIKCLLIK